MTFARRDALRRLGAGAVVTAFGGLAAVVEACATVPKPTTPTDEQLFTAELEAEVARYEALPLSDRLQYLRHHITGQELSRHDLDDNGSRRCVELMELLPQLEGSDTEVTIVTRDDGFEYLDRSNPLDEIDCADVRREASLAYLSYNSTAAFYDSLIRTSPEHGSMRDFSSLALTEQHLEETRTALERNLTVIPQHSGRDAIMIAYTHVHGGRELRLGLVFPSARQPAEVALYALSKDFLRSERVDTVPSSQLVAGVVNLAGANLIAARLGEKYGLIQHR